MSPPVEQPPRPEQSTPGQSTEKQPSNAGNTPHRRRSRLRRWAKRATMGLAIVVLGLLVLLGGGAWWLLGSGSGRDFALEQAVGLLPPGTLTWQRAEGPLVGPLSLHDVRYAADGIVFTARRVHVNLQLRPLLDRRLRIDALELDDATLQLPQPTEDSSPNGPFQIPQWPDVLPEIQLPLLRALSVDGVRVRNLQVQQGPAPGTPIIAIHSFSTGLDVENGRVRVRQLALDSDRGELSLEGEYASADNFHTRLNGAVTLPAPPDGVPARFDLQTNGDLDAFTLTANGRAPGPVTLELTLRDGASATPTWTLHLDTPQLDPALLTAARPSAEEGSTEDADTALALTLDARGRGSTVELSGRISQDGPSQNVLDVVIAPSTLAFTDGILELRPLAVELYEGTINITGQTDLKPESPTLDATVQLAGLRIEGTAAESEPVALEQGEFALDGTLDAWRIDGNASLRRGAADSNERAEVAITGNGDRQRIDLQRLTVNTPSGTLTGQGRLQWAPRLAWQLDANLEAFDPGYLAPDFPGSISGKLVSRGEQREDGQFDVFAQSSDLSGTLRGLSLGGHAELDWRGDRGEADVDLQLGDSRAQVTGTFRSAPQLAWELEATLEKIDPSDFFLTDFPGSINGKLVSRGEQRQDGLFNVFAESSALSGTVRGRRLAGRAELDWRGDRGETDVDLQLGDSHIQAAGAIGERIDIDARLTPLDLADLLPNATGTLQGTLSLRGPRERPDMRADLSGTALHWGDYAVESLTVQGNLPWQGGDGALTLQANALKVGIVLDTVTADVSGSLQTPRVRAALQSKALSLELSGSAAQEPGGLQGRIDTLRIAPATGAAWTLQQPAIFAQNGDRLRLDQSCFTPEDASGSLCAQADWPNGAEITGRNLPLALLDPWLARDENSPMSAFGELEIAASIAPQRNAGGGPGAGWTGQATLRSSDGGLRMAERGTFNYDSLELDVDLQGNRIDTTLAARLPQGDRIDGQLTAGLNETSALDGELNILLTDLSFIELFSPEVESPSGRVSGQLGIGGTRAEPLLTGSANLAGFTAEFPTLGLAVREGRLALDALPSGEGRIDGRVVSGQGALDIAGTLQLDDPTNALALTIKGDNVTVANTAQLSARASPDLAINLDEGLLKLRGEIAVPFARINLIDLESSVSASPDVVITDPEDPPAGPPTQTDIDLTVAMGDDVRLSGYGFDGKLDGQLRVLQRPQREMLGSGNLTLAGEYTAYGQELEITQARLSWANSVVDNPNLDVTAQREIEDAIVGLTIRGTVQQPITEVFSDPPMAESEALSYLVLGSSTFTLGKALSPRLYVSYGISLFGTGQVLSFKYLLTDNFDARMESSTQENRASLNWHREK